ncbi:enoyl-CoA hydratase/isomerase family protein [Bacillus sp. EB600]|uniref:enoyl-CoA hydratase/isomerase family protein n=1 Tax=Bacillus sp. EB600 TaxID=2806345 RepID=UPI00210DB61B|nr:enoyl-CoA hydratase/isomerase family protein [Bacillus sp. EB600]MCQ6280929.1 enoyl-CoA hydratase/isomerase family protein [Bacillus sp. EB600]
MNEATLIKIENGIGFIRLNRPEKLNSLSNDLVESFTHNLESLGKNENVKVIIVSGEGKGFCAGGDLETMKNLSQANEKLAYMKKASALTKTILNLDKYVVSAVHGFAAGAGYSLALASDFIVANKSAKFGLSFVNVGVIPDLGLMKLLSERVPLSLAKEWILTGKIMTAEEAKNWGIINRITEGDVLEEAIEFSQFILNGPQVSNKYVKQMLNHGVKLSWDDVLGQENMIQALLMQSEDYEEGINAFYEKRAPQFK